MTIYADRGDHGAARRMRSRPVTAHHLTVGLISDTRGLLRPQAVAVLRGSDLIVHAGDVRRPEVLDELRAVAPTFAVRGNVDRGAWAEDRAASAPAARPRRHARSGGRRASMTHFPRFRRMSGYGPFDQPRGQSRGARSEREVRNES